MLIGIVSDLHGKLDNRFFSWIEYTRVEAILQLGDYNLYACRDFPVPVYWVYGNCESKLSLDYYTKEKKVPNNFNLKDLEPITIDGLTIVGINGAENPKGDNYTITFDKEYLIKQAKLLENSIDILITHEPVCNVLDTSIYNNKLYFTGNPVLREVASILKPRYIFSGHCHINAHEVTEYSDTYILGLKVEDWIIFDTEKYKNNFYPIDNVRTLKKELL